jgi:hypothetical protein
MLETILIEIEAVTPAFGYMEQTQKDFGIMEFIFYFICEAKSKVSTLSSVQSLVHVSQYMFQSVVDDNTICESSLEWYDKPCT